LDSVASDSADNPLEALWGFETEGKVNGGITISGSTVYFGSYDGRLYAVEQIEANEISQKWRFDTYGRIMTKPAVVDGDVYFGSEDNFLYSVSSETGEENWKTDTDGKIGGASPTVEDSVVYSGSGYSTNEDVYGRVHAVDAEDGEKIWTFKREAGFQSPSVVDRDRVYQSCRDGKVYCLDRRSGEELWSFEGGETFCSCKPTAEHGVLYVGSEEGQMYAIDADNGNPVWEFETGGIVVSNPVVANGVVHFGSNDGYMYAVDADTGEEVWRFEAAGGVFSSPEYKEGTVYFGCTGGEVYKIDAETGEQIWRVALSDIQEINGGVLLYNDTVYFGTDGGSVYAVQERRDVDRKSRPTLEIQN
jgi:outer membrane protein assembly factor BamB